MFKGNPHWISLIVWRESLLNKPMCWRSSLLNKQRKSLLNKLIVKGNPHKSPWSGARWLNLNSRRRDVVSPGYSDFTTVRGRKICSRYSYVFLPALASATASSNLALEVSVKITKYRKPLFFWKNTIYYGNSSGHSQLDSTERIISKVSRKPKNHPQAPPDPKSIEKTKKAKKNKDFPHYGGAGQT